MEEIVRGMTELILRGKVFYWGTSEWSAEDIQKAYDVAREFGLIPPTMDQPQYHIFHRARVEQEYAPLYNPDTVGLGTTIWSPLASGLLTGKYNDGIPADSRVALPGYEWLRDMIFGEDGKARLEAVRQLGKVADDLGTSMSRMAIAWCLKNPHVSTVITGASKVEQVTENMEAIKIVPQMTDDVMKKIDSITAGLTE
jgi:aryl-alcohol dehydrogenase-like predicted oxidoreductase